MKIEMGESLFYSWMRHVKECQIVQTNWKSSPKWLLYHKEELENIMNEAEVLFKNKGYTIFKKNASLDQVLRQAEGDALGISISDEGNKICAVDVAFHEGGLLYGSRKETVSKVVIKLLRTAMCIYGYFNMKVAEIRFASSRIYEWKRV